MCFQFEISYDFIAMVLRRGTFSQETVSLSSSHSLSCEWHIPSHQILLVDGIGQAFVTTISLQATLGRSDSAIVEEASPDGTLFETNGTF